MCWHLFCIHIATQYSTDNNKSLIQKHGIQELHMNSTLKAALIVLPLTLSLSGCLIINSDEVDPNNWSSSSDWQKTQRINKEHIATLDLGVSYDKVKELMGVPDINEAYEEQGKTIQVLFYRTKHKHSDSQTTKDECTPLIFEEGVLVGFGHKAYSKL